MCFLPLKPASAPPKSRTCSDQKLPKPRFGFRVITFTPTDFTGQVGFQEEKNKKIKRKEPPLRNSFGCTQRPTLAGGAIQSIRNEDLPRPFNERERKKEKIANWAPYRIEIYSRHSANLAHGAWQRASDVTAAYSRLSAKEVIEDSRWGCYKVCRTRWPMTWNFLNKSDRSISRPFIVTGGSALTTGM